MNTKELKEFEEVKQALLILEETCEAFRVAIGPKGHPCKLIINSFQKGVLPRFKRQLGVKVIEKPNKYKLLNDGKGKPVSQPTERELASDEDSVMVGSNAQTDKDLAKQAARRNSGNKTKPNKKKKK